MICCAITAPDAIFAKLLCMRWLRWTGKISYGVYLWHVPIFILVSNVPMTETTRVVTSFAVTFGIAALSFRHFETPFLNLKQRFGYADSSAETWFRKTNPEGVTFEYKVWNELVVGPVEPSTRAMC